jgi:hypothetical protein
MSNRKPLPENCDGTDYCDAEGHIVWRGGGHWRVRRGHIDLTPGQRKTLAERQAAVRTEQLVSIALIRELTDDERTELYALRGLPDPALATTGASS